MRIPTPGKVRIAAKSLAHSQDVLQAGVFNKCGQGSKTYHERNVARLTVFLDKWGHLLEVWNGRNKYSPK